MDFVWQYKYYFVGIIYLIIGFVLIRYIYRYELNKLKNANPENYLDFVSKLKIDWKFKKKVRFLLFLSSLFWVVLIFVYIFGIILEFVFKEEI